MLDAAHSNTAATTSPGSQIEPVRHWSLKYDLDGHWGLLETPASRDSADISTALGNRYPWLNTIAVHRILENVFDNVANYSHSGRFAQGTVELFETPDRISVHVTNSHETRQLPECLRGRIVRASDGRFHVPDSERDARSGGGGGIPLMCEALPHIWWRSIHCPREASLSWNEFGDGEARRIRFELEIPIPTAHEQLEFRRRNRQTRLLDSAVKRSSQLHRFRQSGESEGGVPSMRDAQRIVRAMQFATERQVGEAKYAERGPKAPKYEVQFQFDTLARGLIACAELVDARLAREVVATMRHTLMLGVEPYALMPALVRLSPDRNLLRQDLLADCDQVVKVHNAEWLKSWIVSSYALETRDNDPSVIRSLADSLTQRSCVVDPVCNALSAIGALAENQDVLREAFIQRVEGRRAEKVTERFPHGDAPTLLRALGQISQLSPKTECALVRSLIDQEVGYQAAQVLKGRDLSDLAKAELVRTFHTIASLPSPNSNTLYRFDALIKKSPGAYIELFNDARLLVRSGDSNLSYRGGEMLEVLPLSEQHWNTLVSDLRMAVGNGRSERSGQPGAGTLVELLQKKNPERLADIRDVLVSMIVSDNDSFYACKALKVTKLTAKEVKVLQSARDALKTGQSASYLNEALEIEVIKSHGVLPTWLWPW
jgi:hypothetical protein